MTAIERRLEKPRPNSRMNSKPAKVGRVLKFPKQKVHRIPYENRFPGFSDPVREALDEMYSQ